MVTPGEGATYSVTGARAVSVAAGYGATYSVTGAGTVSVTPGNHWRWWHITNIMCRCTVFDHWWCCRQVTSAGVIKSIHEATEKQSRRRPRQVDALRQEHVCDHACPKSQKVCVMWLAASSPLRQHGTQTLFSASWTRRHHDIVEHNFQIGHAGTRRGLTSHIERCALQQVSL